MERKKASSLPIRLFLLLACAVLFSGCVYLRLLKVKKQLADFDEHYDIKGKAEYILEFKNLVLYGRDAVFLIGTPPFQVTQTEKGEEYYYEFELLRPSDPEPPLTELTLELKTEGEYLTQIIIPKRFQRVFSRKVITECLRQAANAKVYELRRKVQADIKLPPETDAELPTLDEINALMGEPYELHKQAGRETRIYRYRIRKDKNDVKIFVRFTFRPDGALIRTYITWDKSSADATFIRPPSLNAK